MPKKAIVEKGPSKEYSKESCPQCGSDVMREKGTTPNPKCKVCGTVFNAQFP